MRHHARALIALAAAYALTLQAILLAVAEPMSAGGSEFGSLPICSSLGAGRSAPLRHTGACPGACLGCCCGPPVCHLAGPAVIYGLAPVQSEIVAIVASVPLVVSLAAAHRSRAPPLA